MTSRQGRQHAQGTCFVGRFTENLAIEHHGRIGSQDHGAGPGIHGARLLHGEPHDHDICGFAVVLSFIDVDARGGKFEAHVLENLPAPGRRGSEVQLGNGHGRLERFSGAMVGVARQQRPGAVQLLREQDPRQAVGQRQVG